ncbi:MAG: tandem-95 repeat protein, partial [Planctomycetes bacterium]|nr:tandem-95 repeat protein [Planctomycetota bacterium]
FITTDVRVTISKDGIFEGWIDFTDDGDWDDPLEKVVWTHVDGVALPAGTVSVPLTAGTHVLTLSTPSSAAATDDFDTYARFRVSTDGDLTAAGLALDGEVEDYLVPIRGGRPPVAQSQRGAQALSVDEDGSVMGMLMASDPDSDPVTFMIVSGPANGAISDFDADTGKFTYTPDPDFFGTDSFTFKASDDFLDSTPATIEINVAPQPDDPIAQNVTFTPREDASFNGQAPAFDPDDPNAPLTYTLVSGVTEGQLTFNTDGSFTYVPNPDFDGIDSFTFTANDGTADSNVGTVTLDVQGTNDPPIAGSAQFSTPEDMSLVEQAPLTDIDDDMFTFTITSGPSNGQVVFDPDGTFTYTPDPDFFGSDMFTFTANDGEAESNEGTVAIDVVGENDPPDAMDDPDSFPNANYTTSEDQAIARNFAVRLFANDTDAENDPISLDSFQMTSDKGAAVQVFDDGTFSYDPRNAPQLQALGPGQSDTDTFTYTITDGQGPGNTDTATVSIMVNGVNDDPVAVDDPDTTNPFPSEFSTDEDSVLTIDGALVLSNDFDPEGAATLSIVPPSSTSTSAGASITFDAQANSFTYDPTGSAQLQALQPNDSFDDTFTYAITDGNDTSLPATVTVRIFGVNDAPTANPDQATTESGIAVRITVLSNDTDVDDPALDPSSVQLVQGPSGGVASPNADGSFTYRSDAEFVGVDEFTYRVADPSGAFSAPARVTITVNQRDHMWQNPENPLDVSGDGLVTILDALLVVNTLRDFGNPFDLDGNPPNVPPPTERPLPNRPPFVDPTGDENVSVADILVIVQHLRDRINSGGQPELQGEGELFASQTAAPIDAAPDAAFPGYHVLTDISSESYFRRLDAQKRDAALADFGGEEFLSDEWSDAAVAHTSSESGALRDDADDARDDTTNLAALDAVFGEGFDV